MLDSYDSNTPMAGLEQKEMRTLLGQIKSSFLNLTVGDWDLMASLVLSSDGYFQRGTLTALAKAR